MLELPKDRRCNMNYSVLVVAAGKDAAKGQSYQKALASFDESKSVLSKTISVFMKDEQCTQIVIVTNPADMNRVVTSSESGKIVYVKGTATRQGSVLIGLTAIAEDVVLIHDGVRPWIRQNYIDQLLVKMETESAAVLAIRPVGGVHQVENGYLVPEIMPENVVLTQTPQAFKTSFIIQCYRKAIKQGLHYLDDAQIVNAVSDEQVAVVTGDLRNSRFILKD